MAQWKRAGPITQRSEDQNLALLVYFYYLKECLKTFNFFLFIYFSPIKLKKNDAMMKMMSSMKLKKPVTSAGECAQRRYRSPIYGLVNVLVSKVKSYVFNMISLFNF